MKRYSIDSDGEVYINVDGKICWYNEVKKEINHLNKHIAVLEQQLTEKDKQLFEENLQVKRLESQLSHYQGGVEVETIVKGDVELFNMGVLAVRNPKLKPFIGQRVRVLVMPLESEV